MYSVFSPTKVDTSQSRIPKTRTRMSDAMGFKRTNSLLFIIGISSLSMPVAAHPSSVGDTAHEGFLSLPSKSLSSRVIDFSGLIQSGGDAEAPPTLASHEIDPSQFVCARPEPDVVLAVLGAASETLRSSLNASRPDRWTCRAPPKEILAYEALTPKQQRRVNWGWRGKQLVRQRFGHDIDHWRDMHPLYQQKGVCNLGNFITQGLTTITFFGAELNVNNAIAVRLKRAEYELTRQGMTTAPFEVVSGFFPRTTRGPFGVGKNLSRHGLGIAVDFDWHKNPYLSRRESAFLTKITDVKMKRSTTISAGERWDSFKRANDRWRERIGPWLAETQLSLDNHRRAPRRGQAKSMARLRTQYHFVNNSHNLRRAIDHGFLSLPRSFVVEMEKQGLTWATDFGAGPDLMHFELRDYVGNPVYKPSGRHSDKIRQHHTAHH